MTTLDQTNHDTVGAATADLGRLHATLRALAVRVHHATRGEGGTPQELRTLSRQIEHLQHQLCRRPSDDLLRWLVNLQHRVEAHSAPALAMADEPRTATDFPAASLA